MKIILWFTIVAYIVALFFFFLLEKLFGYPAVFFQRLCELVTKQIEALVKQRKES